MATGYTARGTTGADNGRWQAARAVKLIATIVAGIIVVGILLVVLEANPGNDIVGAVLDVARWLVGPFKGLFDLSSQKLQVVVNWGIAAAIYVAIGTLLARLIAR